MQAPEHDKESSAIGRRFRDWCSNREGVAAVEFALCAAPFLFLIFAIIETGIILTAGIVLENGVHNVGRLILTGQLQQGEKLPSQEEFRKLVCDEVSFLFTCANLEIDLRTSADFAGINLAYDPSSFQYQMGAGDQISVLRVYYDWNWTTSLLHGASANGDGSITLSAITAFRNEPFPCQACT